MILGGLALAFSRLIDNSVVVLENIFRHLEMGESPEVAAEKGGEEVAMAVLAATFTTVVVFFPGRLPLRRKPFLFTALAMSVILSMFASYAVAMTRRAPVLRQIHPRPPRPWRAAGLRADRGSPPAPLSWGARFNHGFNRRFTRMLDRYGSSLDFALLRPLATVLGIAGIIVVSLGLYPLVGKSYFPRTDPSQFVINLKAPDRHPGRTDQRTGRVKWRRLSGRSCQPTN